MKKIIRYTGEVVFWIGAALAMPGAAIAILGEWITESVDD